MIYFIKIFKSFILLGVLYFVLGFISMEWDYHEWPKEDRVILCVIWVFGIISIWSKQ